MGRGEGVPSSNLIFHQVQNTGEKFLRAVLLGAAEALGDILQYRLVAEQVVMLKDHGAHGWNTSGTGTFDNSGRSDGVARQVCSMVFSFLRHCRTSINRINMLR